MNFLMSIRKFVSIPMLLTMFFPYSLRAVSAPMIAVTVDGNSIPLTQPPISYHGRVMVPLRGIFENLGASVVYDPATRTINATRGNQEITLTMGSQEANINGQTQFMDVPPLMIGGRMLVPLRFVSQALGTQVSWDAYTHTVNIVSLTGGANLSLPPSATYNPNNPNYTGTYPTNIGNFIQRIAVSPQTASLGQSVTITMIGTPGGSAVTTIAGNSAAMTEISPGTYQAAYLVTSYMQGRYNDVSVRLSLANGQNQTVTDSAALYVSPNAMTGSVPLSVGSISNGLRVGQRFTVNGMTTPNATVTMRLMAPNGILGSVLGVQQTILTRTINADANGNFSTVLDSGGNIASGTTMTLSIQSQDPNGSLSPQQQFQIYEQ